MSQYPITRRPKRWAGWCKLTRWDGATSWVPPTFGCPDEERALAGMTPLTLLLCVLAGAVGWLVLFFGIWWLVAHIGGML